MSQINVAIQIVNYKTKIFLDPLISSIIKDTKSSNLNLEINIIDNNSGDDITDIAALRAHKNVHVYKSKINGGFGAGHNILATKTKAEYLLILNPDVLFIEVNTIINLVNKLKLTKASVIGPKLLTPIVRSTKPLETISLAGLKQQTYDHGKDYISPYKLNDVMSNVAWVSGAVFLIKHEDFSKLQFDERFFLYYEELDLCLRLRREGKVIIYEPNIKVLHYGSVVAKKFSVTMLKSFIYFYYKRLINYLPIRYL